MKKILALTAVLLLLVLSMGPGIADTHGQNETPDIVSQVTGETTSSEPSPPPQPPPSYPPINQPPVAEAGPNQTVYVNEVTHFSGTGSYDPDGTIIFYKWDLGDGEIAYGQNVSHTYQEPGSYTVNLTVTDNGNAQASDTCTITVRETPPPPPPPPPPPLPPILDNLTITPDEIERGDNVTISFDIRNTDSQSITYGVDIHIENVNDPPPTWPPYNVTLRIWVELEAYESKTVSHTLTMDDCGDFNVTVHGMTGSFKVGTWPPEPPLRPAELVLSDLTVTPEEAELWGDIEVWTFRITVNVTNVGEQEGMDTIDLRVDGLVVEWRTVELGVGEETMITYVVTRGVGSYTAEVDGLTGNFTVKAPPKPAEFVVSDLEVDPERLAKGDVVTITVEVENIGETEGTHTVQLEVDGLVTELAEVTLAEGESTTVTFTIIEVAGDHTVGVEDLTGDFTVTAPISPGYVAVIIIVIIASAALLYAKWKGILPTLYPEVDDEI